MTSPASSQSNWLPLESNPTLMNTYISNLGVSGSYTFHDVYGTESDLLSMVPKPVIAVLLLFPISENSENYNKEEEVRIEREKQYVDEELYFIKQTVSNACGTIGLIHSILNNRNRLIIDPSKFFGKFLNETLNLDCDERAKLLESNTDIELEHLNIAEQGDSDIPDDLDNVNLHFIAFVTYNDILYELDGRKKYPINHGPSSEETLLEDSVNIIKQFMERDPENLRFNMVALAPNFDD